MGNLDMGESRPFPICTVQRCMTAVVVSFQNRRIMQKEKDVDRGCSLANHKTTRKPRIQPREEKSRGPRRVDKRLANGGKEASASARVTSLHIMAGILSQLDVGSGFACIPWPGPLLSL